MKPARRLDEVLGGWFDRLEIGLAGGEPLLRRGREALIAGEPLKARALAHEILARSPSSPVALALLADATSAAGLSEELAATLEDLVKRVPPSGEIWLRLARVRTNPHEAHDAYLRAVQMGDAAERRSAILGLAELDLRANEPTRADVWLDRIIDDRTPDAALLRLESATQRGAIVEAQHYLPHVADDASTENSWASGVSWTKGRAFAMLGDERAIPLLLRAHILGRDASQILANAITKATPPLLVERVERVIASPSPALRAAILRAKGSDAEAADVLREAAENGDESAKTSLLEGAIARADRNDALRVIELFGAKPTLLAEATRAFLAIDDSAEAIERLLDTSTPELLAWADRRAQAVIAKWFATDHADWRSILDRLDRAASTLRDFEALAELSELARSFAWPLRVAVIGEFNAGKSTFVNALFGEAISPMGILPTTATAFIFRFGTDRVARLKAPGAEDRLVTLDRLAETLKTAGDLEEVTVFLPLPSLQAMELIDTPGFNAPIAEHREHARAALAEADALIWLVDAGQPLKESERRELESLRDVPLQFIVNKADRLKEAELAQVLAATTANVQSLGFSPLVPPFAVSSKEALRIRKEQGADVAAQPSSDSLERSGWSNVEALVDKSLLGERGVLMDRARRRRLLPILSMLEKRANDLYEKDLEERARRREAAQLLEARRVAIAESAKVHSASLIAALTETARMCQTDFAGLPRESPPSKDGSERRDGPLERYRASLLERALLPPLRDHLRAIAEWPSTGDRPFADIERGLLGAVLQVGFQPLDELPRLAQTALRILLDGLAEPPVVAPRSLSDKLVRELRAIRLASERNPRNTSSSE